VCWGGGSFDVCIFVQINLVQRLDRVEAGDLRGESALFQPVGGFEDLDVEARALEIECASEAREAGADDDQVVLIRQYRHGVEQDAYFSLTLPR
jgi:hypothetical protein